MAVKKILVPISPAVRFERVASQAIWLAMRYSAELLLLRVGSSTWDVDDGVPEGVAVKGRQKPRALAPAPRNAAAGYP